MPLKVLLVLALGFMVIGSLCPCLPGSDLAGAPCCDFCPPSTGGDCCQSGTSCCSRISASDPQDDSYRPDSAATVFVALHSPPSPERSRRTISSLSQVYGRDYSLALDILATEHLLI